MILVLLSNEERHRHRHTASNVHFCLDVHNWNDIDLLATGPSCFDLPRSEIKHEFNNITLLSPLLFRSISFLFCLLMLRFCCFFGGARGGRPRIEVRVSEYQYKLLVWY